MRVGIRRRQLTRGTPEPHHHHQQACCAVPGCVLLLHRGRGVFYPAIKIVSRVIKRRTIKVRQLFEINCPTLTGLFARLAASIVQT